MASALGAFDDKRVAPALIKCLEEPAESSGFLQTNCAEALGDLKDFSATQALCDVLLKGKENVRYFAAKALLELGDQNAEPALIEALSSRKVSVRYASIQAWAKFGTEQSLTKLHQLAENGRGEWAMCTIKEMASEAIDKIKRRKRNKTL